MNPGGGEPTDPYQLDPYAAYQAEPYTVALPADMPRTLPLPAGELVPASHVNVAAPYGSEPVLVQIGLIQATATTVHTPSGSFPLRGSTWAVNDRLYPVRKTPTWAIVLAIVLAVVFLACTYGFSLLFLLFLLAKETRYEGFAEVFVAHGGVRYVAQLPMTTPGGIQYLHEQVNYLRVLAAQ